MKNEILYISNEALQANSVLVKGSECTEYNEDLFNKFYGHIENIKTTCDRILLTK